MMPRLLFASHDAGLLRHWQAALGSADAVAGDFPALQSAELSQVIVWLDLSLPALPTWDAAAWRAWSSGVTVIATSSRPQQDEAMHALDAGCVGYCHAFADRETLAQVQSVVAQGGVWIGRELMQRFLSALHPKLPPAQDGWKQSLTEREREVATLAARGLSNRDIATQCKISERTVKAHLAAVFEKLGVADRLQLTLKVHGIS